MHRTYLLLAVLMLSASCAATAAPLLYRIDSSGAASLVPNAIDFGGSRSDGFWYLRDGDSAFSGGPGGVGELNITGLPTGVELVNLDAYSGDLAFGIGTDDALYRIDSSGAASLVPNAIDFGGSRSDGFWYLRDGDSAFSGGPGGVGELDIIGLPADSEIVSLDAYSGDLAFAIVVPEPSSFILTCLAMSIFNSRNRCRRSAGA